MEKSSIHIKPVKNTSESHNLRLRDFDYVRKDLTPKNFNVGFETKLSELRKNQDKLYQEKVGQKMQKKTTPIREGVFLFEKHHTNQDILKVVKGVQSKFGIKPVQLSVHRDEGHYEKHTGVWKPNLHAHVVFDWQNKETGKTFKLGKEDMSKLQTYFAEGLGMERGQKSTKTHINSLKYKAIKKEKELKLLKEEIKKRESIVQEVKAEAKALVEKVGKTPFDVKEYQNDLLDKGSTLFLQGYVLKKETDLEKQKRLDENKKREEARLLKNQRNKGPKL